MRRSPPRYRFRREVGRPIASAAACSRTRHLEPWTAAGHEIAIRCGLARFEEVPAASHLVDQGEIEVGQVIGMRRWRPAFQQPRVRDQRSRGRRERPDGVARILQRQRSHPYREVDALFHQVDPAPGDFDVQADLRMIA